MDPFLITTSVLIIVLLALSAFFSGSETALTAASRPLLHQLELSGDTRARAVNELREDKERLLGSILIGNNLVNILASVLATRILIEVAGNAGVIYATIAMTVLVVVFAEVLPKSYAISHANRASLAVAPVVRVFLVLFSPFAAAVQRVVRGILWCFGVSLGNTLYQTEDELRGAIELHRGDDQETRQETVMLRSILDLGDVGVGEVLIHRSHMATVNADLDPDALLAELVASPFSRIPLWRDNPDNIIGVVHSKAVLRALREHGADHADIDVLALAAEPWFIPESTSLLDQLQAFRQRGEHFALVVDEYGDLLGIVTLEDILEEIVGDISDEHDIPRRGIRPQKDGLVVVDGDVTIRDLNRRFDWALPDEDAATIAGLVLHESRMIPEAGQVFTFLGFRFEVLRREGNRVAALRIQPPASDPDEAGTETGGR